MSPHLAPSLATQPRGSPLFQSRGHHEQWPKSRLGGYITPAAWGIPAASERGTESEVAQKWARWLHNPCRLGIPCASEQGTESEVAQRWGRWLQKPCRLGGSPPLQSGGGGGGDHRWPTSVQGGYITPFAWGSPPLQSGGPNQCGRQVGKVAT